MATKPITVARQDFIKDIVKLINESGLPAFVISDILKSCVAETEELAKKQYEEEMNIYNKQLDDETAGEMMEPVPEEQ